jgi:hypothetical protein
VSRVIKATHRADWFAWIAFAAAPVDRPTLAETPPAQAGATVAAESEDAGLTAMRTQVQGMAVRLNDADGSRTADAELVATPLIHYSDQQRKLTDSTLWVWQSQGRPVLFSKLERLLSREGATNGWQFCCTPTTDATVDILWGRRFRWRSKEPALKWQDFDVAPPPAAGAPGRLLQMKSLANRFHGEIVNTRINDREQMRLLARPLHRYQSPTQDVVDGAVFGITSKGTNPDSLLLIEAVSLAERQAKWRFGVIGMTGEAVSITLADKVAFEKPFTDGPGDHRSWVWYVATGE